MTVHYDGLVSTATAFRNLDRDNLIRKNLGSESLENKIEQHLDLIEKKIEFALSFGNELPASILNAFTQHINQIVAFLSQLIVADNSQFISQKNGIIAQVENELEAIKPYWSHFVTAAVENSGILADKSYENRVKKLTKSLETTANNTVTQIKNDTENILKVAKEDAQRIIDEAISQSQLIEGKARKTAQKISVQAAQEQFGNLLTPLSNQIKIWAVLSGVLIFIIICLLIHFSNSEPSDKATALQLIHRSTLHLAILGFFGTLATYCMRILKTAIHMYNHNKHRCVLANSIEAFVESTSTPEQRDLVLIHLINAISDFGTSGLVEKSGETTNFSIGSVSPSLTGTPK